jgi:acyl-CoA synthetase (AMP-forming)/AMP-acid ligase II
LFTTLVSDDFQEVIPAILPFYHIYGLLSLAIGALYYGQKVVTVPKFEPMLFMSNIVKYKVNITTAFKSLM